MTPIWGQRPHRSKTTFLPHGVADPKLGSGRPLDQVLRFF